MARSDRIKAMLADEDFLSMVQRMKDMLTKKVMSKTTSEDERLAHLAEYHALDSLINLMRSEAHNAKDEK